MELHPAISFYWAKSYQGVPEALIQNLVLTVGTDVQVESSNLHSVTGHPVFSLFENSFS
jgi:hypothetical protein